MRESELLRCLGLPSCPYKHGQSSRVTTWIKKGLPFTTKSSARYFNKLDIEGFLQKTYSISVEGFKQHLKDKDRLPYISVEYL